MSTSPVTGGAATQFLYAVPGGGVPVFTRIPKQLYSVDALYYSVTLGSTDSSLG